MDSRRLSSATATPRLYTSSAVVAHRLGCPKYVGSSWIRTEPMSPVLAAGFLPLSHQGCPMRFKYYVCCTPFLHIHGWQVSGVSSAIQGTILLSRIAWVRKQSLVLNMPCFQQIWYLCFPQDNYPAPMVSIKYSQVLAQPKWDLIIKDQAIRGTKKEEKKE